MPRFVISISRVSNSIASALNTPQGAHHTSFGCIHFLTDTCCSPIAEPHTFYLSSKVQFTNQWSASTSQFKFCLGSHFCFRGFEFNPIRRLFHHPFV